MFVLKERFLLALLKVGALDPVIDSIFTVEDAAKAHQHIHDAKNVGKVLLRFK